MPIIKSGPPFYSKNFPDFLNYGRFGTSLAHEFAHGLFNIPLYLHSRKTDIWNCLITQYEDLNSKVGYWSLF